MEKPVQTHDQWGILDQRSLPLGECIQEIATSCPRSHLDWSYEEAFWIFQEHHPDGTELLESFHYDSGI